MRKAERRSEEKDSTREVMTRGRIAGEVDVTWAWVVTSDRRAWWTYGWTSTSVIVSGRGQRRVTEWLFES